jgi:uncharacterized protein YjlB
MVFLASSPALAAPAHPFLETFGGAAQPSFGNAAGMAVDQSTGDVLVIDVEHQTLTRFHADGTPADFSALGSNEIPGLTFGPNPAEVQVAVDNSGGPTEGDIYVPQAGAKTVNIYASTGEKIGQLTESTEGEFSEPCGVAVDPSGNVYVADFAGIHKYTPAGNPAVNADKQAVNFAFPEVCEIAAGAGPTAGSIFAVSFFSGVVAKLDSTTGAETIKEVTAGPTTTVTVDPSNGHLYAASEANVREFGASGSSAKEVSSTALASNAQGIALSESTGNLYATRAGDANIEVYAPIPHVFLETFGSAAQPSFGNAAGMAVDQSTGDVLVIDVEHQTLTRFHADGTPADFSFLGSNEIPGLTFGPNPAEVQVAVDNSGGPTEGDIYVPQAGAKTVNIYASTGEKIGQLTESTEGEFSEPCGVAVDPSGNVYVADFAGIHKYTPAGNPAVNADKQAVNFAFPEVCEIAAGAGPTAGSIFAVHFFSGAVAKLDSTTGAETIKEVTAGPATTVTVDPSNGHLYAASEANVREFGASGSSAKEVSNTVLASNAQGIALSEATGNLYTTRQGDANVEVYAPGHFNLVKFELAVDKTGSGSGTVASVPAGIACGSECAAAFAQGKEVTLKATAAGNSHFTGWSTLAGSPGTCTGTTSPCKITIGEAVHLQAAFTLIPTPAVTALSPSIGPGIGGTVVEITGTNLDEATSVRFGSTVVSAPFTEDTATKIVLAAPSHAGGTFDVVVTTGGGPSATTPADQFTFVADPAVFALTPAIGPLAGGNVVEITGKNLANATQVQFGSTVVSAPFTEDTAAAIRLAAPAHAAGTVDVRVTTLAGTTAKFPADTYTYQEPAPVLPVSEIPTPPGAPTLTVKPPPPPPPPPSNHVSVGVARQHGHSVSLTLTVAAAGKLTATGKGLKPATATATRAGTVTVTLKLTNAAARQLKRKGRLTVTVTIAFLPTGGTPGAATKTVTFKTNRKRK